MDCYKSQMVQPFCILGSFLFLCHAGMQWDGGWGLLSKAKQIWSPDHGCSASKTINQVNFIVKYPTSWILLLWQKMNWCNARRTAQSKISVGRGWGFSSEVERLPRKRKALGSVPSSEKKNQKKNENINNNKAMIILSLCFVNVLPTFVSVYTLHTWCQWR